MSQDNFKWDVNHPKYGEFHSEWFDEINFEELDNVISVHGFIFDENKKFCVVKFSKRGTWMTVGGGPEEEDKTFEDTLLREIQEEADLEVKNIKRIGYVKSVKKDGSQKPFYNLRYVCEVCKIKPQTIDPAEREIPLRKFISAEEFEEHCRWGKNGEYQIKKALEALKNKKAE